MKRTIACVLLSTPLIAWCGAPADKELEEIHAMEQTLEQGGLEAFAVNVKAKNWKFPEIPSAWHVDHISTAERKPVDAAARTLGRTLAGELAKVAREIRAAKDPSEIFGATGRLCDLSSWCSGTKGYG